jgi:hypothetical protein
LLDCDWETANTALLDWSRYSKSPCSAYIIQAATPLFRHPKNPQGLSLLVLSLDRVSSVSTIQRAIGNHNGEILMLRFLICAKPDGAHLDALYLWLPEGLSLSFRLCFAEPRGWIHPEFK